VTLFGIVDLSAKSVKNGSNDALRTMAQDGINSSRLGVRGVEDLGGGMSASFWLEGAVNGDTGTPAGQTWTRRSTISLLGGFGELRLGRDYTPSFWNTTIFDPFGTNGVGSFLNLGNNVLGTNATTYVRANNSIGYFLPGNLGGLYGQAQVSAQEQAAVNGNKQNSARIGYAAGPINVAASYGSTDALSGAVEVKFKHNNIAGSYNFGVATLMLQYDQEKAGALKAANYLIGTVVPLGQGEIHASYVKANQSGSAAIDPDDASQIALGYVYNLSKRTAMYGTWARISNKGGATGANFLIGGGVGAATGEKSTGYEVGLRHSF
jgi:predicted porin